MFNSFDYLKNIISRSPGNNSSSTPDNASHNNEKARLSIDLDDFNVEPLTTTNQTIAGKYDNSKISKEHHSQDKSAVLKKEKVSAFKKSGRTILVKEPIQPKQEDIMKDFQNTNGDDDINKGFKSSRNKYLWGGYEGVYKRLDTKKFVNKNSIDEEADEDEDEAFEVDADEYYDEDDEGR